MESIKSTKMSRITLTSLFAVLLFTVSTTASAFVNVELPTPQVTIVATKVVCNDQSNLPKWGNGGPDITSTTATDYVANSDGSCHVASNWSFQWGDQNTTNPGDVFIGEASGFTTFGATDNNGIATTNIALSESMNELRLREVLKAGYIPFTYGLTGDNSNSNSAEFYCANDVENYDNFDFISNPQAGATYYCVAFNVAKPVIIDGGGDCPIGQHSNGDGGCIVDEEGQPPVNPPVTGGGSTIFDYWGCTNKNATNFNSIASKDDGSCKIPQGGSSSSTDVGGSNVGEVLGASTTTPDLSLPTGCTEYIHSYMRQGRKNDSEDVSRLQTFLNETMGAKIPVTGIFGSMTRSWVKKFQVAYHGEIIKPWIDAGYKGKDIENGTGYVYKTTKRQINMMKCSSLNIPLPDLSSDIK